MIVKYLMKYLKLKNQFLLTHDWKSYCLHHIILTIAHKNLILETTRVLQSQCFFQANLKTWRTFFFRQVESFLGR